MAFDKPYPALYYLPNLISGYNPGPDFRFFTQNGYDFQVEELIKGYKKQNIKKLINTFKIFFYILKCFTTQKRVLVCFCIIDFGKDC